MPTDHEYDYRKDEFLTDAQKELIEQEKRNVARELTSPVPVEQSDATVEDTLRDCAERLAELIEVKAENDALQGEVKRLRKELEDARSLTGYAMTFAGEGKSAGLLNAVRAIWNHLEAALRGEEADDPVESGLDMHDDYAAQREDWQAFLDSMDEEADGG